MTCPRCKCQECRKTELNAVLSRRVSRETSVEEQNAQAIALATKQSAWRDTYVEPVELRRFLLPREPGRPLVDPDAEQLAADVVLEHARAG